jgi:MFS family permease
MRSPFRIAVFWLGIQAVWGALLGISLQARTIELVAHAPIVAYGRLATAGALVAAVVQIVVGIWSDMRRREGSRRIGFYITGALAGAVSLTFFYNAPTFGALIGSFIALQASLNVAIGPYQAIIPDFVQRARFGIASSWMAALQSAGNAIGALAASAIGDARVLAATLGTLLVGTSAVTVAHIRNAPLEPLERRDAFPAGRAFVDLFVSRALVYVGFYTLLGYLLFYVRNVLGAPSLATARWQTGILVLAFTLVGTAGAALAARPSDRFDRRAVANAGGVIVILALGVFILTQAFPLAVAATLIAGLGWGVFLVADWAIACRILPESAIATTMGVWNLAILIPQIVAPALTTVVLAKLNLAAAQAPKVAFGLAASEILLGIAWLWRLSSCAIGE